MTERRDLLIEIGTEELPPRALLELSVALGRGIAKGLEASGIAFGEVTNYATPRRLGTLLRTVETIQPERTLERRGPPLRAAFDAQGNPTAAATGFARSCGLTVPDLQTLESEKGSWLVHRSIEPGHTTAELAPAILNRALDDLPIPKRMRWSNLDAEFIRPVHWVLMLLGDAAIEAEILGIPAGRTTYGHRFHHPEPILVAEPATYAPLLETRGHVIAEFRKRRSAIRTQVLELTEELGGRPEIDEALLDEITALVEWPVALYGAFDARFLELPREVLTSSMKGHQRYFPVLDRTGALLPYFIAISNIDSSDPAVVRRGNERVIRPRLTDATFFWKQDRKCSLESRLQTLKSIVFQERLGTLYAKTQRIARLAEGIAVQCGVDPDLAARAGQLCKSDLTTEMVAEFPDLQGIMGRYYSRHDGEPEALSVALAEQYQPRFAGDAIPASRLGQVLALADRIDTLVGIFGIGMAPSGDKDPFGLRRAALGSLRILIEGNLDLNLLDLLSRAAAHYGPVLNVGDLADAVFDFVLERLRGYCLEQGIPQDVFEAVLAQRPPRPLDFFHRALAVSAFQELPEAESLAVANKRIRNLLRQAASKENAEVRPQTLVETAERELHARLCALRSEVLPALERGDYTEALGRLAALRQPVDAFFDEVMVLTDEEELRRNRLALLRSLSALFLRVADLSRLQSV
jgi:glycyl-tRNA synthetase beta chain